MRVLGWHCMGRRDEMSIGGGTGCGSGQGEIQFLGIVGFVVGCFERRLWGESPCFLLRSGSGSVGGGSLGDSEVALSRCGL